MSEDNTAAPLDEELWPHIQWFLEIEDDVCFDWNEV